MKVPISFLAQPRYSADNRLKWCHLSLEATAWAENPVLEQDWGLGIHIVVKGMQTLWADSQWPQKEVRGEKSEGLTLVFKKNLRGVWHGLGWRGKSKWFWIEQNDLRKRIEARTTSRVGTIALLLRLERQRTRKLVFVDLSSQWSAWFENWGEANWGLRRNCYNRWLSQ